ncbi:replication protein A 70 kDa DNA-binding subunit B [Daucus carota subsp. sativus]|uniref:replication protein A 70 kDa DNA-binding subunit B n=1 Tax=Daucus carota subsp. sativus TaxID=79200 RepID=UPI003083736A
MKRFQDDHILAIVRNNQRDAFLPMLKENEVYSISNLKLVPGPKLYRSVDRDLSVNFFYKTKIEEHQDTGSIPRYKFELQPFHRVKDLVGDTKCLIDVIGMVMSYGQLEKRSNDAQKMDVVLMDTRLKRGLIDIILADCHAAALQLSCKQNAKRREDVSNLMGRQSAPVHVLHPRGPREGNLCCDYWATGKKVFSYTSGASFKLFHFNIPFTANIADRATLSSTDATRSYFNIDYEPLNALNEKLSASIAGGHNSLQAPTARQFVTANENQPKELQIKSILEAKIPVGNNVLHCLCKGTIIDVLNGNGWYYICCPKCARAVRELEGKFYCAACTEEPYPVTQRYRVVIRIEDGTGSTTLTLFNKEAEQIIGAPLNTLLKEIEKEKLAEIPPALKNLIGKKCAFQIKITPYNIEKGCEEYTVTRVSELSLPPITNDAADSSEGSNKKQRTT